MEKPEVVNTPAPIMLATTRNVSVQNPGWVFNRSNKPRSKSDQQIQKLRLFHCQMTQWQPAQQLLAKQTSKQIQPGFAVLVNVPGFDLKCRGASPKAVVLGGGGQWQWALLRRQRNSNKLGGLLPPCPAASKNIKTTAAAPARGSSLAGC